MTVSRDSRIDCEGSTLTEQLVPAAGSAVGRHEAHSVADRVTRADKRTSRVRQSPPHPHGGARGPGALLSNEFAPWT